MLKITSERLSLCLEKISIRKRWWLVELEHLPDCIKEAEDAACNEETEKPDEREVGIFGHLNPIGIPPSFQKYRWKTEGNDPSAKDQIQNLSLDKIGRKPKDGVADQKGLDQVRGSFFSSVDHFRSPEHSEKCASEQDPTRDRHSQFLMANQESGNNRGRHR